MIQCHAFHCHIRCCHLHITGCLFISYFRCDNGFTCRFRCHFAVIVHCRNICCIAFPCNRSVCCIIRFYCCSQGCFLSSNQFQAGLIQCHAFHCHIRFCYRYGTGCCFIPCFRCDDGFACTHCGNNTVVHCRKFRIAAAPCYSIVGSVLRFYGCFQCSCAAFFQRQFGFIQCYPCYRYCLGRIDCHFTCGCLGTVFCCYCDDGFACTHCGNNTVVHCRNFRIAAAPCYILISCITGFYLCFQCSCFSHFQCQFCFIQSNTLYRFADLYSDSHCTCGCLAAVRCCYCDGSLTSSPCCYSTILVYCGNSFVIAAPCHIFISCICRFYGCCQFFTAALNQYNFCFVQTHACHTHANLSTASLLLDITIAANCHIGICLQCIHSAVDCQRCIGCCYLHICYIGIHGHRFFCFYHNFFQSCGTASIFIF